MRFGITIALAILTVAIFSFLFTCANNTPEDETTSSRDTIDNNCEIPEIWDIECTVENGCVLHVDLRDEEANPCHIESTVIKNYQEWGIEETMDGAFFGEDQFIEASSDSMVDEGSVYIVFEFPEPTGDAQGLWDFGLENRLEFYNEVAAYIDNKIQPGTPMLAFSLYGDPICMGEGGVGVESNQSGLELQPGDYVVGKYTWKVGGDPDLVQAYWRKLWDTFYGPTNEELDIVESEFTEQSVPYTEETVRENGCSGYVNLETNDWSTMVFGMSADKMFYNFNGRIVAIFVYDQANPAHVTTAE
jgi:hypothetical protein